MSTDTTSNRPSATSLTQRMPELTAALRNAGVQQLEFRYAAQVGMAPVAFRANGAFPTFSLSEQDVNRLRQTFVALVGERYPQWQDNSLGEIQWNLLTDQLRHDHTDLQNKQWYSRIGL